MQLNICHFCIHIFIFNISTKCQQSPSVFLLSNQSLQVGRHCSRGGSQGDKGEESCDLMDQFREGIPCIRDSVECAM